jgi:hypothetical protein
MSGHVQDAHRPGRDLHHEQHVHALKQHSINVQEVAAQDGGCLGGQELAPGWRCVSRRGAEARCGRDPTDRPFPPVSQAEQLTLDAPVTPAGFCRANSSTSARTSVGTGGRPGVLGFMPASSADRRPPHVTRSRSQLTTTAAPVSRASTARAVVSV